MENARDIVTSSALIIAVLKSSGICCQNPLKSCSYNWKSLIALNIYFVELLSDFVSARIPCACFLYITRDFKIRKTFVAIV